MPRETVISPVGPSHVKVGWSADREVQVGVEVEGERSIFWQLLGHDIDQLTRLGEKMRAAVELGRMVLDTLDVHSHGGYKGVWSGIDRSAYNRPIRLVRRARDSAFGRDE
jgi:hypothetical protein